MTSDLPAYMHEAAPDMVYIANRHPDDDILYSGAFITVIDFARAAIAAGKSENYGSGVMRDLAKRAVLYGSPSYPNFRDRYRGIDGRYHYKDPHAEDFDQIGSLMDSFRRADAPLSNPDDNRHRVLLGMGFLFDTWRANYKIQVPEASFTPRLPRVALKIVGLIFEPDQQASA